MNKKIFLAGLLCLASVASVVGMVGNAHEVEAAGYTYYIEPKEWTQSNAQIWGHFWEPKSGSGTDTVQFSDIDGDGIYEANVSKEYSKCLFVRQSNSNNSINWDENWYKTNDLTIPNGKNNYTIGGDGWDGDNGTWSNRNFTIQLAGSMTTWATNAIALGDNDNDNIYETEIELDKGEHSFKILKYGNVWLGNSTTNLKDTFTDKNMTTSGSNVSFTTSGGSYKFAFNVTNNKLSVTYKSYDTMLNELLSSYYNSGSYTKDSVLNINSAAIDEVSKYFHASATTRYRKTVYSTSGLTMTTSTDGNTYADASTYSNGDNCVTHTGFGGNFTVNEYSSVEDWFVTLHDFVANSGEGWTKEGNVYSHDLVLTTADNEDELTRMAREFVAPMWLAPNAENFAYAQFTKLTVEEVGETLVMKLYVDNGDILVQDSNNVFSQVTIY